MTVLKIYLKRMGLFPRLSTCTRSWTSQLDVTGGEEQLRAAMRKATRYEIKKSANTGGHVRSTR